MGQKYRAILILCILILSATSIFAETTAITESGEKIVLFKDGTYRKNNQPKVDSALRSRIEQIGSKHSASANDIEEACSLAAQGWCYVLPQPKSRQAAWGNSDGRTTWWYGYWKNNDTNEYSSKKPELGQSGIWIGDGQKLMGYYRRGGSPSYPTKVELMLSSLK